VNNGAKRINEVATSSKLSENFVSICQRMSLTTLLEAMSSLTSRDRVSVRVDVTD
jgi:hypothetical protein